MICPLEIEIYKAACIVDNMTKSLLRRIGKNQIAIINHIDIDEEAANGFIEKKVLAVINFSESMTGRFPTLGLKKLLDMKIPVYDVKDNMSNVNNLYDGIEVIIDNNNNIAHFLLNKNKKLSFPIINWTEKKWREVYLNSINNIEHELESFINNTLDYANKEKKLVLEKLSIPELKTKICDRQVLVVIRGNNFRKDLRALNKYIENNKPVLIGVDGGADALIELGFIPDIIIGDMDSVSDNALKSKTELIVHGYPSGSAPGMVRIRKLGLTGKVVKSIGTSEDLAMLLAFEKGAEKIVVIGAHTNMVDFLEKGRNGMASTLLVRMKIGHKLVDAKCLSLLEKNK